MTPVNMPHPDNWHELTKLERAGTLPDDSLPDGAVPPRGFESVVFINDVHAPFHDTLVWGQVIRWLRHVTPERLVINGDFLDCPSISRFAKNPLDEFSLHDEARVGRQLLGQLRDAVGPGCGIDFVPGNHEKRISDWMDGPGLPMRGMAGTTLREILDFDAYDIYCHTIAGFKLRPNFHVYHGELVPKSNGFSTAARAELSKWNTSGTSGHTHYKDEATKTLASGTETWYSNGCLCQLTVPYITGPTGWHHQVMVGLFERGGLGRIITPVPIRDQELIYQGRSFA